ncbi:MAG: hypothetical protein COB50_04895 [Thiotrichales bacterium]|nr:MAG: hypothetical protein COB50_04895 [Thiotrichales bacterium]
MSLLDLKKYLQKHQKVSLDSLAKHFTLKADLVMHMLRPLISKGLLKEICITGNCSTCTSKCALGQITVYCWQH